jgi:hypothetical protein
MIRRSLSMSWRDALQCQELADTLKDRERLALRDIAGNFAVRRHDDLRIRPGRIRDSGSSNSKPFVARILASVEKLEASLPGGATARAPH